jgi:hypothetical protein
VYHRQDWDLEQMAGGSMGLGWVVDGKDGFVAGRWSDLDYLGLVAGMTSLWGYYGSPRLGGLGSEMGR